MFGSRLSNSRCPAAPSCRGGYTLLEVLLAMAISVLLLGALYVAVDNQLRLAKAGREVVEQATLARALFAHIQNDIASSTNLADAARYRVKSSPSTSGASTPPSAGGMGPGGGSPTTSPPTPGAGGGASSPAPANGGTSSSTGTGAGSTSSSSSTVPPAGVSGNTMQPLGVQGDASTLHLFASKVPREVWGTSDGDTPVVSDLRRISYWLVEAGDTQGLARQEIKVATSQEAATLPPGIDNEASYLIADEVRSVSFSYFDGTTWQDSWDSTQLGSDGKTPIGPPRAIAITLGIQRPGSSPSNSGAEPPIKTYRHVVAILSANGTTLTNNNPGGGTTVP